jgi:hypothetical protein
VLLAALEAVPEHGHAVAPAPAADAPVGETLDGAFPTLPELDDEVPIVEVVAQPAAGGPLPAAAAALEVEHVAEPAQELAAADLAVEPLPDDAPHDLAPAAAGVEDGATMEWDNQLPDLIATHDPADGAPDAPLLTGGKVRRSGPRPLVLLLPILLVIALAAGAAAVAGFFDSNSGAPAVDKAPAPRVQAPVTTPLPIKIKPKAPTSGTSGSGTAGGAASATPGSTGAATGTDGTAGTGATDATGTTP